jgi:hypothetical protein
MKDLDPEQSARLHGLMAMLALPPLRDPGGDARRIVIEIEVLRDQWEPIDAVIIEPDRLVCSFGVNGHRVEWAFLWSEGVPRWRTNRPVRTVFVPVER